MRKTFAGTGLAGMLAGVLHVIWVALTYVHGIGKKSSLDILKAVGAEVVVCPTNVLPEDPNSYYSVATRLAKEIPNSCHMNQYDNLANRQAHYESTGPEIWDQTDEIGRAYV